MARVDKSVESAPGSVRGTGADKSAVVDRRRTILAHWPSADRLARAMGVSASAFRKWLKGEAEPSRDRLVALAEAAGVSVSWLGPGEGPDPDPASLATRAQLPQSAEAIGHFNAAQFLVLPRKPEAAAAGAGHH